MKKAILIGILFFIPLAYAWDSDVGTIYTQGELDGLDIAALDIEMTYSGITIDSRMHRIEYTYKSLGTHGRDYILMEVSYPILYPNSLIWWCRYTHGDLGCVQDYLVPEIRDMTEEREQEAKGRLLRLQSQWVDYTGDEFSGLRI